MGGTIVALGGLSPDHNDESLHRFIVESANKRKPRVCLVPLASGDLRGHLSLFYEQYPASICEPNHLELLREVTVDPAETLARSDIVYLGGGSTPILVAALRILRLDGVLRAVLERGGVLCGHSAGAHAWFDGCITDSLGPQLEVFADGLGVAPGTCVAHFDDERAAILNRALAAGELPDPAWCIEDGAALVLSDGAPEAVSSRDQGGVRRVTMQDGRAVTELLDVRRL